MGKRVIRLTEADIEKIVKKVIKEQSRNYLVNRPGGGKFKVEGDTLYYTGDNKNFYKIWEVGAKPTYKVDVQNRKVSPTGLLNLQSQLFNGDNQTNTERFLQSYDMLPLNTVFENPVSDTGYIYYYYLTENGEIGAQCSTVIKVNNKTLTDRAELMNLKTVSDDGNLPVESNDNTVTFGETYINVAKNTNLLVAVSFGRNTIKPTPVEPKKREFTPETIKLDLVDVFEYDSIKMKEPSGYQEILNKFKDNLIEAVKNFGGLKEFLEKQNLVVNGYASQDADPTENDGGNLPACSKYGKGKGPRSEYNKCLSQERAQKVANDLQEIFNSLGVKSNIKSVGHGETYKFGGDGWNNGKDSQEDLSKNRRVTFNIPEYAETIKK